ncbi:MAG: glycosyltransferase family 4 protein [Acidobacteriia bacterium]|nr:glycosyltransferase family 4 protein [Terriglobia bacterium]
MRPAALFLSPEAPYPLAGGGALRSASLLHYLARGHDVDVIVFREPGAPDPAAQFPPGLVRRVSVIPLPAHSKTPAARALRGAVRLPPLVDRFGGFARQVEEAVEGARYDIGLVEHFWCAPYWQQISRVCRLTALDLHNVESALHGRCARAESGVEALAHRAFRQASLALEREWLPRYGRVLAASHQDAQLARAIAPAARLAVYPNAIPPTPLPTVENDESIVFSGNMEYHPNLSAVRFFSREVWPLLRSRWPALVWRLVGRNPGAVSRFAAGDARIENRGPVIDAVTELARSKVAVAPILAGSGTRFKILEAWAAGTPVVSTTLGAEGLPARDGENILLADTAPAFAQAVSRLLTCSSTRERLAKAGRRLLEQQFTWESAWRELDF